jgi:hypothetical protein
MPTSTTSKFRRLSAVLLLAASLVAPTVASAQPTQAPAQTAPVKTNTPLDPIQTTPAPVRFAPDVAPPITKQDGAAPTLVWRHAITDRVEKSRIKQYGVGPYADGQGRLETEDRGNLPLDQVDNARAAMDKLAADPKATEKVFGPGTRLTGVSKPPRKVLDIYLDTTDGQLAKKFASLRIRIENGIAQVNYKPPGGLYFKDGMKVGLESGLTVAADQKTGKLPAALGKYFLNTRLVDNPLGEIMKQFPGLKATDFMFVQLEVSQNRKIYDLEELEGGQYVKKAEMTVDKVTAYDPSNHKNFVEYGRAEIEGDHVSAGALSASQQMAIANSTFKGPLRAKHQQHPGFAYSPDVTKVRAFSNAFASYLGTYGFVKNQRSKYVTSRALLEQKGVRFDRAKLLLQGHYAVKSKTGGAAKVYEKGTGPRAKATR